MSTTGVFLSIFAATATRRTTTSASIVPKEDNTLGKSSQSNNNSGEDRPYSRPEKSEGRMITYNSQIRLYRWRKWWSQLTPLPKYTFLILACIGLWYLVALIFPVGNTRHRWADYGSQGDSNELAMIRKLQEWAKDEGLVAPALEIVMTWKGKTMIAKEDIPEGDLFRVPWRMLLCFQLNDDPYVKESQGWQIIADEFELDAHWTESLLLLYEKQLGTKSKFYLYHATMTAYEDLPLPAFWEKEEDLMMLEPAWMREYMVNSPNDEVDEFWPRVAEMVDKYPEVFDKEVWTLRNFKWACAMVWSHAFNNEYNDQYFSCMVPVVDFMNHENEASTWWDIEEEIKEWVISGDQNFKKGDEVTISYGVMSNTRLLKWFGFAILDNKNDAFHFEVPWGKEDPLYREKKSWMKNMYYDWVEVTMSKFPKPLFAVARQAVTTQEEWSPELISKPSYQKKKQLPPFVKINCDNERRALKLLTDTTDKYLSEYSTTVEEDEKLLAGDTLSKNQRNAVILRIGHKKILNHLREILAEETRNLPLCRED